MVEIQQPIQNIALYCSKAKKHRTVSRKNTHNAMLSRAPLLALLVSPAATGFSVRCQSVFQSPSVSTVRSSSRLYLESNDVIDDAQVGSEDLYLADDASTTSQFLAGLWQLIAKGNTMVRGVSFSSVCSMKYFQYWIYSPLMQCAFIVAGIGYCAFPSNGITIH
jgi:hypothetical protein